ncbi:Aldo/keto reductase subgroup [Penicillium brevicompactum]|uniref:D-xylose reductase [NAD(P)H] n=1 Tax=Penicillium brevicompactum TaxID=5074 RepID=A0A9W9UZF6_PENBR|nr:Aldo/keto reductase subgroup [Penicillium brevicompactum]
MFSKILHLSDGNEMPLTGYGLWDVDRAVCADQVYAAIKEGYRCFDGACDYGNEVEAGLGIARAIKDGLVQRSELFIVSKLWCTFHDPKHVKAISQRQLSDWGLEYFDLYLIHFPVALEYVEPSKRYPPGWTASSDPNVKDVTFAHIPMHQTWASMENLVEEGLARSIGISNFDIQLISDLLSYARIAPAVLQIEHHPYLTQPRLVNYAQARGIAITAYCSFGPQSAVAAKLANVSKLDSLLDHQLIMRISNDHNKSPSQVLLRWATQRGIAVIPKSKNLERMRQNMDMQWSLEDSEIGAISDLNQGLRLNDPVLHGFDVPVFS